MESVWGSFIEVGVGGVGVGWGRLTSGWDNMSRTCLNSPQMNCDGRHVLWKWLQLAWTERANCCHLDRPLVVQLEKWGLRTQAPLSNVLVCVLLSLHTHRGKFKEQPGWESTSSAGEYMNADVNTTVKPLRSPRVCLNLLPCVLWWCQLAWEHSCGPWGTNITKHYYSYVFDSYKGIWPALRLPFIACCCVAAWGRDREPDSWHIV